jgi:DNA-binding NtrC family response regulator
VPPLRARRADVGPLVQELTAQISSKHGTKPPKYTRASTAALRSYDWPGNVRELRNVVELVCLLRDGRSVRVRDLPASLQEAETASRRPEGEGAALGPTLEVRLDRPLHETVDEILQAALDLEDGNRSRAARRLGISLRTVQRFAASERSSLHSETELVLS